MKLVYLFLFVSLVYSQSSLFYYLSNTPSNCFYLDMAAAFNASGLSSLINGSATETLFAVCDPLDPLDPVIPFDANLLRFHCVDGIHKMDTLPTDGAWISELGDPLRILKFETDYFLNGVIKINLASGGYYCDDTTVAALVTNGVLYTIPKPLIPLTSLNKLNILEESSMIDLGTTFSFMQQLVRTMRDDFSPAIYAPSSYWTFFVPSDDALSHIPLYQKDYLQNTPAAALDIVKYFGVPGSNFMEPLKATTEERKIPVNSLRTPQTWSFEYLNYGPGTQSEFLSEAVIERWDILRADGVMHTIGKTVNLPLDFPFPLPTGNQFVQQFTTFDFNLKAKLIPGYTPGTTTIEDMLADLIALGITIPSQSTVFLVPNDEYTPITDANQLKYHIIPVKNLLSQFALDTLISTISLSNGVTSDQIRITQYGNRYFLNGYSEITTQDIELYDCYVNFINTPLVIPYPPDYASDCSGTTCYKLSTINESITIDGGLSKFRQLLENAGFDVDEPPMTVIALANEAFDSDQNLFPYLLYNRTKLDEFLMLHIISGTFYPSAGTNIDAKMTNLAGMDISISWYTDGLILKAGNNDPSIGVAHLRADGVYYRLTQPLYPDFSVPDTPVAPVPVYTPSPPAALPFDPNNRSASFVNAVTLAFLIISCFLVFIIQ